MGDTIGKLVVFPRRHAGGTLAGVYLVLELPRRSGRCHHAVSAGESALSVRSQGSNESVAGSGKNLRLEPPE